MKRLIALLIIIAMLCLGCCSAEESTGPRKNAEDTVMVINFVMHQFLEYEFLFSNISELVPDSIYSFSSNETGLDLIAVIDPQTGETDLCTFTAQDSGEMTMAFMCSCCLVPHDYLLKKDPAAESTWNQEMMNLYDWYDGIRPIATEAIDNGEIYTASYTEGSSFHVEVVVVPLDDGTCQIVVNHYLRPAEA